jgi:hypothetical protein
MKTLICLLLIGCTATGLFAQSGNYFLSHYTPSDKHFDNVCFDMAQDQRGVMYFATKAGVLEFDGSHWDLLHGQSAVYSLQINSSGDIYWSGAKGFGKISYDNNGFQQIETLSDSTVTNVFHTLSIDDITYFLSDDIIYVYKASTGVIQKISATDLTGSFTSLFEIFDKVYTKTENKGVFEIESGKLKTSDLSLTEDVVFSSRIDEAYVFGTASNKVYTCSRDLKFTQVTIHDQAYVEASVIISGSWVNRQLLALGTLRGGVIFLNPITGKTIEIVNYGTGLPDNEVFALMPDKHHNVWIAHDYGYTKVSPSMPFRSFSHYSGLQGNLLCAYSFGGAVYVGTTLGLFKLQKEDLYDELIYYVDVEIPNKRDRKQKQPVEEPQTETKTETESKKGGFFSFLRRKKREDKVEPLQPKTSPAEKQKEEPESTTRRFKKEKRTEKILRTSQYVFRKVGGIEAKITHILSVNGKLLASGLGGLYEVSELQSKPILTTPVRYVHASDNGLVLASTYQDDVHALKFVDKKWIDNTVVEKLEDQVNYIFDAGPNQIWLCGLDKIYKIEMKDGKTETIETLQLINPNFETTVGIMLGGDSLLLANGNGFYQYFGQSKAISKIDSLPKPSQYFAHDGSILYRDEHGWKIAGDKAKSDNLQLLNLFEDLRFIASDAREKTNLWMISGSNELYKFYGDYIATNDAAFPIFLKSIINHDQKIGVKEIRISEEHSAVKFEVVQPDYISPQAIEFRYFLKGMNEEWSAWSSSNDVIDFPYLPPGDYELQVQARNIFGQVAELNAMPFEVQPPYWKRPWFYALEFALIASLVLLSFRLSTRYRIISRLLSLLTIILLIEFIQTAINVTIMTKDSPVIDFIIQVFVALLVLPVEGYLRNLMLRSLDTSSKVYKFVDPKRYSGVSEKPKQGD